MTIFNFFKICKRYLFNVLYFFIGFGYCNLHLRYKVVGDTRHYPPANKEWTNSVYAFNKNILKPMISKDRTINKLVKSYFYLFDNKKLARSKRMRSRILKSSTKRFFISKCEVKQTNEKVYINIFVFDRQKQYLLRKLYFMNRNYFLQNLNIKDKTSVPSYKMSKFIIPYGIMSNMKALELKKENCFSKNKVDKLHHTYDSLMFFNNRKRFEMFKAKRRKIFNKKPFSLLDKNFIPYHNFKLKDELRLIMFKSKALFISSKFKLLQKYFLFNAIKYVLSFFSIKVYLHLNTLKDENGNSLHKAEVIFNIKDKMYCVDTHKKLELHYVLTEVNNMLLYFMNFNSNPFLEKKFSFLLYHFLKKNYTDYVSKFFRKETLSLIHFSRFLLNNYKLGEWLSLLKTTISRTYNKKVDINLISLKYPHLNSDIFTQSIANKLRKKTGLLKVLSKSLRLVKTPYKFVNTGNKHKLDNMKYFSYLKTLNIGNFYSNESTYSDSLQGVMESLYPREFTKEISSVSNNQYKISNILNSIKYKWVSGVRLEAAGRLTRRNTASRSMFKLRYKGNLKNIDYSNMLEYLKKNMSSILLRNLAKPNHQYSFNKSKKRIGAFGLKGWISGY